MKLTEALITEFDHETKTTRRHLERLPNDKLNWKPHEKSFSAGGLASHIVECITWVDSMFNQDEFDIDPATYKPYEANSVSELLKTFDENVAQAKQVLSGVTEERLTQPWRFKVGGKLLFERPKYAVFRDFVLSHVIHHRGQYSVYLRLLDVPVPGSYGPTADEQSM